MDPLEEETGWILWLPLLELTGMLVPDHESVRAYEERRKDLQGQKVAEFSMGVY